MEYHAALRLGDLGFFEIRDRFWIWFAWRLPRRLVYWCTMRLYAHATTGQFDKTIVPDLAAIDALERWDK